MNLTTKPLPGSGNSSGPDSSPMGTLTPGASLMSSPVTSPAMPSATSSPGSADGALPYSLQDGLPTDLFGPGVAPASLSAAPASSSVPPMNATYGQLSSASSASAALSLYLGSRLQTLLVRVGSMEYRQTWSKKATPAGRPYWAHTASALRTSGKDCSGWQTPRARGDAGGSRWKRGEAKNLEDQARIYALMRGLTVSEVAALSVSPKFCRRLMGYPEEWDSCGATAMQSSRKSPPRSSKQPV